MVLGFIYPLVVNLAKDGQIDSFFFVRYGLGGPHIRLRLHVNPGAGERTLEAMQHSARRFLELTPSTHSVNEEAIRRTNDSILAGDLNETDDSVYPDNSFRVTMFSPEFQRYGGLSRLPISLDFFTLSSLAAIEFVSRHRHESRAAKLAGAFSLLLRQALCFAAEENELSDLLRYGVNLWGEALPKVVEKGDKVARSQSDAFLHAFRTGLSEVRSMGSESEPFTEAADFLAAGAKRLSVAIGTADPTARSRIASSQLHMTATRLGLSNAEEVYISRLLTVTLDEVRATGKEDLSWLEEKMAKRAGEILGDALRELLPPALFAFSSHAKRS